MSADRMKLALVPIEGRDMDHRPALRSTVEFLLERFYSRPCDSDGVDCCERCNVVFLAQRVKSALGEATDER